MSKKTETCLIEAPCKINLHLRVKNRRKDGFHELESLFAALEFGDSLEFQIIDKKGGLEFTAKTDDRPECAVFPKIPDDKNLVCRAISLFREKTGFGRGIRAVLTKRVPLGAGLGGGSSDAASTLIALDSLAGTKLPERALFDMACALGSDVPFFLNGGAAWVRGKGEMIEKTEIPRGLWVLLVMPNFTVSTSEAFELLDKSRERASPLGDSFIPEINTAQVREILLKDPEEWPFYNDFLPVLPGAAVFRDICAQLKTGGAAFAGLTGSGSCCFGIFREKARAEKFYQNLQINDYFVKLTFFLARRPYPVLQLL